MDDITTEPPSKGFELFLNLVVIAVGIVFGLISSLIISLLAGWIEFAC